jgi:phage N-6-adenine-methyltransferase
MNTSFEKAENTTDEWYTPIEYINALGEFDLDPAAAINPLWQTAKVQYTKEDDGLSKEWFGRVWLNPPYSRPLIVQFMEKMAEHNNGIMLVFNRADSKMFHRYVFEKASGILFMEGRIRFYRPDGTQGGPGGTGSVFVAYGKENAEILKNSGIKGKYIEL